MSVIPAPTLTLEGEIITEIMEVEVYVKFSLIGIRTHQINHRQEFIDLLGLGLFLI